MRLRCIFQDATHSFPPPKPNLFENSGSVGQCSAQALRFWTQIRDDEIHSGRSLQPSTASPAPAGTWLAQESLRWVKRPHSFDAQPDLKTTVLNNIANLLINTF